MQIGDTKITSAGIYRCCFDLGHGKTEEFQYGSTLNCPHCDEEFTLTDEKGTPLWVPTWQLKKEE